MRVKVVNQHLGEGSFPTFKKGTTVALGEQCMNYPHWYPCIIEGYNTYVPDSFVHEGKLICDYNPTELVAEVGDVLEVHEIINAWLVVKNAEGATGWIPAEAVVSEALFKK